MGWGKSSYLRRHWWTVAFTTKARSAISAVPTISATSTSTDKRYVAHPSYPIPGGCLSNPVGQDETPRKCEVAPLHSLGRRRSVTKGRVASIP